MRSLLCISALCCFFTATAQKDTVNATSQLTHANVYYGFGASLSHTSRPVLSNGMQQLVISGLALQPDVNTIQVSCPENVTILSSYHRIYYKPIPKIIQQPSRSLDSVKNMLKLSTALQNSIIINEDMLRRITLLIENNFATPAKKEISSNDLITLTGFYLEKVKSLKEKIFELQLKKDELAENINEINTRINRMPATEAEQKPTGQLILQVMVNGSGSSEFGITYFTRNAGWIPAYDIRMKTIDNSLKMVFKATVTQTTGLDWSNTSLSLSTSNPNQSSLLPVLTTTNLQLQQYVPVLLNSMMNGIAAAPPVRSLEERGYELDEVKTTSYKKDNVSSYMTLRESQLNTSFDIDLPYDIPSDGKAYTVIIKEEDLNATYKHFAIPKLDRDAFLLAQLNRWDSLSLLPGEANIIMDNVYLGKSFLDPNATTDTLNLSLGRDKRISVSRLAVKEFTNTTVKDGRKTETFTYELTIKNNKKQSVDLLLKDQYPISREKDIVVELINNGGASVNTEQGVISWNLSLLPGERKKVRFTYTIKYPKDKKLQEFK